MMSRPNSAIPSSAATPVPTSSPPPSESFQSDIDGASLLDAGGTEYGFDSGRLGEGSGLNLVSWKLGVNASAEDGVDKRGFNAISTVLNHPTKKADPLRGTRKPLPPIANPPLLPKPPAPSHYDAYLKAVTPLYDSFVNAQASSSTGPNRNGSLGDVELTKRANLPPLDSVPDLFFDPTFDISSPAVWSAILDSQDDLSTHLDTLESHLIHEIGLRSTSFFSALSNLQDLHSESASCLNSITDLQSSLKEVGKKQARKGIEVIDKHEELRLLRGVETGIREIGEAQEALHIAQRLVEGGDWSGSLGCLEDVVKWWTRHSSTSAGNTSSLPLADIPALSSLPSAFSSLTTMVASQLETALASLLSSILSRVEGTEIFDEERFRTSVGPMLEGFLRCGSSDRLQAIWREAVTTSIREGSRKHLPVAPAELEEEDGKDQDSKGMNLAQSLKSMDHSRYLLLATEMYSTLLSRLHLVERMGNALSEMLERNSELATLSISTSSDPASTKASVTSLDLSDILASACELANARAAKILGVRSDQHAALSITEFVEIFKENWDFVVATEALAKRMIVSLRGVTATQARTFLIAYHGMRLTRSAKAVEEEQWAQVDVPPNVQHTVNLLISSATEDSPECLIPPPTGSTTIGNGESAPTKQLHIEDRGFFVVKATSETLVLLADYLKIVINLELVVMDVMSRIIEFLKSFNSRTCQVVLGAGAMRSAGLKNITAKHLALASQSLSIVVALIPYIREFIRRHLNSKQAVMLTEFDKLKRDYQEHQNEIHAKLVAIMSDRLSVHVAALREIDWEATDKAAPHPYAEMLVKETATLHKVLSKYLAASTVESVLAEVLGAIITRLSEEYGKVELKSDEAKKRMMTDVTVIAQRLSPIAEAGKNMTTLQTLVKDKPVPRKNVSQTMAGLLKRSSSKKDDEGRPTDETEPTAVKDDGDEDGESLGILPSDQPENSKKEDENQEDDKVQTSTLPAVPDEATDPTSQPITKGTADDAPLTPPKDVITETKKLAPVEEDEPIATDTLATISGEKELPVDPVEPMDETKEPPPEEKVDGTSTAPALPEKDVKSPADGDQDAETREIEKPAVEPLA